MLYAPKQVCQVHQSRVGEGLLVGKSRTCDVDRVKMSMQYNLYFINTAFCRNKRDHYQLWFYRSRSGYHWSLSRHAWSAARAGEILLVLLVTLSNCKLMNTADVSETINLAQSRWQMGQRWTKTSPTFDQFPGFVYYFSWELSLKIIEVRV